MASKTEIEDARKYLYEITDCSGMKISIKKKLCTETGTSSLKIKNSEKDKENLCEVTNRDETNKISDKKKRRNKKATCDEASENKILSEKMHCNEEINCDKVNKKIEDPKVSIYEIQNCAGKDVIIKELSLSEITMSFQEKFPDKPKQPIYDIMDFDEKIIKGKEVTVYEIITCDDKKVLWTKTEVPVEKESSHERITCDKANKTEVPVKEESPHEKITCDEANKTKVLVKKESPHEKIACDEANKSEVSVKEESSHEETACNKMNKSEVPVKEESFDEETISDEMTNSHGNLFKLKNNILIGAEDPINELHIGDIILHAFKTEPQFIGQIDVTTGEQITFQQMKENSVKCALWLQKILKDKKDNITLEEIITITICTRNSMNAYIPYLAALYLGVVVNPWDEDYFEESVRILYFLLENMPHVIFVDDHNATKIYNSVTHLNKYNSKIDPIIVVFGEMEGFHSLKLILATEISEKKIDEFSCRKLRSIYNTAIEMFSSNTTSYPGIVQIPYIAFVSPSNMEVPIMAHGEIGLWYESLCWTHSLFLTVRAIISFTTALKCPKHTFDEEHFYQTIEKYKVTWVFLESSMCNKMFLTDIMVKRYDVSSLKKFLFGDTSIEEGIHEDFIVFLPNTSVTQVYCDSSVGVIAFQRDSGHLRSNGHVSKNVQVAIFNMNTNQIVGVNVPGEIWCNTPYSMYIPDKHHKSNFKDDQFQDWYCTGDLGYYDENGEIYVIDKINHLIEYKNMIVSAAEIEEMLLRNWDVAEAVVLPIPVANDGQHPVAFVRKVLGAQVTEEELMKFVEKNMKDCYKLRGGVYFTTKRFPRLPNGKVDRQRVKFDAGWQVEHYFKMVKEQLEKYQNETDNKMFK